jgi:DNA-binding NarL/FixJ family response regulator
MLFVRARERVARENLLTTTERRVAGLIARGRTYKDVASELGVSPATVRNQVHSIYQKLKVNSKFELARLLGALDR